MEEKRRKEYPCIESTIDISIGDKFVRLWIDIDEVVSVGNGLLVDKITERLATVEETAASFVRWVAFLVPRLNAVQVRTSLGRLDHPKLKGLSQQGVVVYLVDFEKGDVHG